MFLLNKLYLSFAIITPIIINNNSKVQKVRYKKPASKHTHQLQAEGLLCLFIDIEDSIYVHHFKDSCISALFPLNSELSQIHITEAGSILQTQVIAEKMPWTETAWKMY